MIWNLVLEPPICQNLLSKTIDDGRQVGNVIVGGLFQVLTHHSSFGKDSGFSLKIKRNATSALGNIFKHSKNHTILFQNKGGNDLLASISQLSCSAREDPDPVIRRRAMRTIMCLIGAMDVGAKNLVQEGDLSSFLIDAVSQKSTHEEENDLDMVIQACQIIIALQESINVAVWSQLQIALQERMESTMHTNVIPPAAKCLAACMSKIPVARSPCFSIKFWNNLERMVSTSSKVHASVCGLLIVIAEMEERSSQVEAEDVINPSILTKTQVINTLTTILLETESTEVHARNQALEVIRILAENESNKKPLAENDRLLPGLVTLCLLQPDSEIKNAAKRIILQLVPEI
jgi:hypothetical protein